MAPQALKLCQMVLCLSHLTEPESCILARAASTCLTASCCISPFVAT